MPPSRPHLGTAQRRCGLAWKRPVPYPTRATVVAVDWCHALLWTVAVDCCCGLLARVGVSYQAITSHMQTGGVTIVLGCNQDSVNMMISTLALFLTQVRGNAS